MLVRVVVVDHLVQDAFPQLRVALVHAQADVQRQAEVALGQQNVVHRDARRALQGGGGGVGRGGGGGGVVGGGERRVRKGLLLAPVFEAPQDEVVLWIVGVREGFLLLEDDVGDLEEQRLVVGVGGEAGEEELLLPEQRDDVEDAGAVPQGLALRHAAVDHADDAEQLPVEDAQWLVVLPVYLGEASREEMQQRIKALSFPFNDLRSHLGLKLFF